MIELPRIALGGVQPELNLQMVLWGLLEGLRRLGISGQVFCSQSRFDDLGSLSTLDERGPRHLDSWLMPAEVSRWLLFEGGQQHDLSIVVGRYPQADASPQQGGSLMALCQTLQLPSIVVLDVSRLDPCRPPLVPPHASALMLVGCRDARGLAGWQTRLEAAWCLPVLGGWCDASTSRVGFALRSGGAARDDELVAALADDFLRHVRWERLLSLARDAAPLPVDDPWKAWRCSRPRLRVAMAYDEVFNCYFPDTMDCLEGMGAELMDFSPLKSECLPESIDLVWLGCGHPERCPERLSRNICLQQSLQAYVRGGGHVYAEGGGLAYICEAMHCAAGSYPMAGLLPAEARYVPSASRAVELQLVGEPWLGQRRLRGYLNPCWAITPRTNCIDYSARSSCPLSLVGRQRVIGSRVHLHFAAQPQLLKSIWRPCHSPSGRLK